MPVFLRNIWVGKVKFCQSDVRILVLFSILFSRWFIKQTLGIWEKQLFSPRLLCVLGPKAYSFTETSNLWAGENPVGIGLFPYAAWSGSKHWLVHCMPRLTRSSPSPVCHSGHPSSVFWQHLQWHCKDEKRLHVEPENFPTEESKWFIHRAVSLAFKLSLCSATPKGKIPVSVCPRATTSKFL